jgi:hypothetical protein
MIAQSIADVTDTTPVEPGVTVRVRLDPQVPRFTLLIILEKPVTDKQTVGQPARCKIRGNGGRTARAELD